jgi:UTP--glucose-1-phosphate uridylyltransferase
MVPGLRAGHYLCFFGMHVLTSTVMDILAERVAAAVAQPGSPKVTLSEALAQLAAREKYLALQERALRYDVGVKYGLLSAQLALALNGRDRDQVLANLVELMATQSLGRGGVVVQAGGR